MLMIKKLITGIYAFAITIAAFATADSGDVIILDGEFWNLLARPIWSDSTLYHNLKTVLPEDRSWTTANWDGYTAWWSIRENRLCLDSIMVEFYNKETQQHITRCIDEADMRRVDNVFSISYDTDYKKAVAAILALMINILNIPKMLLVMNG